MNKKELLPIIIILIMFLIGFYFYPQFPERMPIHWNAKGEIDGYGSRFSGLFLIPLVSLGIYLLFLVIPKIAVYKKNIKDFSKYFFGFKLVFVLFFFCLYVVTILQTIGYRFSMNYFMFPAIAALFYFIGYILKFAKRNFFIGIRTPWTLSNDEVWNKTHFLGSKMFKIASIVAFFGIFFGKYGIWFIMIPILVGVLFLVGYSYLIYQKEIKH